MSTAAAARPVDNPVDAWGRRPLLLWTTEGPRESHACEMRTAGDDGGTKIAGPTCGSGLPSTIHSTYYRYRQILKKINKKDVDHAGGIEVDVRLLVDEPRVPARPSRPRAPRPDHLRPHGPAHPKGRHR